MEFTTFDPRPYVPSMKVAKLSKHASAGNEKVVGLMLLDNKANRTEQDKKSKSKKKDGKFRVIGEVNA